MSALPIAFLDPDGPVRFPPTARAMLAPNGLLAAGGRLTPEWLLEAYARGIFPWFSDGEPVLWWSPDPRCVFNTDAIHVSRSLRKQLRRSAWTVSADRDFRGVIEACAAPRGDARGRWLIRPMIEAYCDLHALGHAHSIEVFDEYGALVGGLYGVARGRMFCGESMFSARSGGSKVALVAAARMLAQWGWPLLDAQVPNSHLLTLGALMMPRGDYLARLSELRAEDAAPSSWRQAWLPFPAAELA